MGAKLKAFFILAVMFGLGTISGVAWESYRTQHAPTHVIFATRRVEQLKHDLQLTPEQEQALSEIFDKAHERAKEINQEVAWDLADIHEDSLKSIHDVLTPDQNKKFEKIHERSAHHSTDKTADGSDSVPVGSPGDANS